MTLEDKLADSTVDIVIVTYNSMPVLEDCLIPLSGAERMTITIVDNGSRDGTETLASAYAHSVIILPENPGYGSAANRGSRVGSGSYVVILNPDVRIEPKAIWECIERLESRDAGVVGCRLEQADGSFDHASKRMVVHPFAMIGHVLRGRASEQYTAANLEKYSEQWVDSVNGALMIMRRADFEAVQGFDESYWMYMEDMDLCMRVRRETGRGTLYCGQFAAVHLKSAGTGRARRPILNFHLFYSSWKFYNTHQRSKDAFVIQVVVAIGTVAACLVVTLRDIWKRWNGQGLPVSSPTVDSRVEVHRDRK